MLVIFLAVYLANHPPSHFTRVSTKFFTLPRWKRQTSNTSIRKDFNIAKLEQFYLKCSPQKKKKEIFLGLKRFEERKLELDKKRRNTFAISTRHKHQRRSSSCLRRASFSVPFVWLSHIWQEKGYLFLLHLPVILNSLTFLPTLDAVSLCFSLSQSWNFILFLTSLPSVLIARYSKGKLLPRSPSRLHFDWVMLLQINI